MGFLRSLRWIAMLWWIGCVAGPSFLRADVALLVEEPYGAFGRMNPTGHAALYFDRICADTPTRLRWCRAGEHGVVISRYHKIDGYDWVAIPLVPYLYAVEKEESIPEVATEEMRATLRDAYRRTHLRKIAPDKNDGGMPKGEWIQLVGSAYDRKIFGFNARTSVLQDELLMAQFNDSRNRSHFNLFFHNCADFSRNVLNTYFPHAVHRNFLADVGLTTPKHIAKSFMKYGRQHPELDMSVFIIPQVPGSIARSRSLSGVAESLVKSKKYFVPLAILRPEITLGIMAAYLGSGRFTPPKDAPVFDLSNAPMTEAEEMELAGTGEAGGAAVAGNQ